MEYYLENWDIFYHLIDPGIYDFTGELLSLQEGYEGRYVPVSVQINVIPEPATLFLLGLGVLFFRQQRSEDRRLPWAKPKEQKNRSKGR